MAPITEPIDFDNLPDNIEQLRVFIWRLAYQKNAIIKARDDQISALLEKTQSLEYSLQLCRETTAAEDRTPSPAHTSERSASRSESSTDSSSTISSPPSSPSPSPDPDVSLDLDNEDTASDTGRSSSPSVEDSASEGGCRAPPSVDDHAASEMRHQASPDVDNIGSASESWPRISHTPSTHSRTSGSSRVSKNRKRGKRLSKGTERVRWDCVWRYSEGDRFDFRDGTVRAS